MEFQQRLEAAYALAEISREEAFGKRHAECINRLESEHDNLSCLLQALLERKDTESGLHLTCLLEELWFEAQYTAEGLYWLRCFLALPATATQTALRASGVDLAGALALQLGDYPEARRLQEEALAIFRKCGNTIQVAYTLFHLGHLSGFVQGDYPAARDCYDEGLNILRAAGHKEGIIHGMANLGTALAGMGEAAQGASLIADESTRLL
jgi:tetratricopeptide (TPR) repeat protein